MLLHDTGPIITSATTAALTETVLLTATSTVNVTPPGVSTTEGICKIILQNCNVVT